MFFFQGCSTSSKRCPNEKELRRTRMIFHCEKYFFLLVSDVLIYLFFSYEAKIKSLYKVPEKFQVKEQKKTEEMLSNQMLSGIPEVDLGLE